MKQINGKKFFSIVMSSALMIQPCLGFKTHAVKNNIEVTNSTKSSVTKNVIKGAIGIVLSAGVAKISEELYVRKLLEQVGDKFYDFLRIINAWEYRDFRNSHYLNIKNQASCIEAFSIAENIVGNTDMNNSTLRYAYSNAWKSDSRLHKAISSYTKTNRIKYLKNLSRILDEKMDELDNNNL